MNIKIKTKSELQGTHYIELSLGRYRRKHWEDTSLFFDEDVFALIEPIIVANVRRYDHYEINEVNAETWQAVIVDLKKFGCYLAAAGCAEEIDSRVLWMYDSRESFNHDFQRNKADLITMINELILWVERNIGKYGEIAILGM